MKPEAIHPVPQLRPAAISVRQPAHAPVEISVVAPVHNEAPGLAEFFARLIPVLDGLGTSYEIICVDDGSSDDSLERLLELREPIPALKVLSLSRNFGKDVAVSAGFDYARGAAVVPIDADLQDSPELIGRMVAKWREGYDVVYATRGRRAGESWFRRITARYFYRVLDLLVRLPERTRFMKGLFAWVGFKQTALMFDREPRHTGASKWSYWRLWNFALDAITSFSSLPLRVWSYAGFVIALFSFLYAVFLAGLKIIRGVDVPGYISLMVVVLFFGGVQLITLGIIGEYMARMYNEVKGRPLYLVRDAWGFDDK